MQGTFLLDIVVRESTSILKLLPGKNQPLLIRRNSFLVLNLALDIVDGVRGLDLKGNRLASQSLDENLHPPTQTQHQMQGTLLLDIVVRKGTSILQLLSRENETLLIRWDALLVLNLALDVVDGVGRLDLKGNSLARQRLDENLHPATQTKDEVESGFLLDVVIGEGTTVFELFSGKNETLLIGWDALFVLDFGLDIVNGVGGLDFESDGLAREGFDKDLHATTETEDEVEGGLFLDVVV